MNTFGLIGCICAAVVLAACGAVQVHDSDGKAQSVGQWLEGLKELPKTPSEAQAQAKRETAAQSGTSSPQATAEGGNTAVAVPDGSPGRSDRQWPAAQGCRIMDPYTTKVDVDTVYARAMRSYTFRSVDQEAMRAKQDRLQWTETNYLHERQPGAYYHLRQTVGFRLLPSDRHSIWLELEIAKNGLGSDVAVKYCYVSRDPATGTIAFHRMLQKRLRDELGA